MEKEEHREAELRESLTAIVRRSPPLLLLLALALQLVLVPALPFDGVRTAAQIAVLLACLAVAAEGGGGRLGLCFAVPAAVLLLGDPLVPGHNLSLWSYPFLLLLYLHILRLMFKRIFHTSVVTVDTIGLALCAYVLLGVLWMLFYIPLMLHDPGAIRLGDPPPAAGEVTGALLYFSYVTLTTLGYGDMAPATPLARGLAVTEALTGVLFLAVLISRLVGRYSAQGK